MRLEEFEHVSPLLFFLTNKCLTLSEIKEAIFQLLEMQQRDSTTCLFKQMPQLSQRFEEMERVFDGIDRLELMVARFEMAVG